MQIKKGHIRLSPRRNVLAVFHIKERKALTFLIVKLIKILELNKARVCT